MLKLKQIFTYVLIAISCITSYSVFSLDSKNKDFDAIVKYTKQYDKKITPYCILVKVKNQTLSLFKDGKKIKNFTVSTSKFGIGQVEDSYQTPIGLHKIEKKIGQNVPNYGIFKARRYTGAIWPKSLSLEERKYDYIVTRILTLTGLEPGINKGLDKKNNCVDSKQRNIYIHGTVEESKLGTPISIGCVYMRTNDIKTLFNTVPSGTLVLIMP